LDAVDRRLGDNGWPRGSSSPGDMPSWIPPSASSLLKEGSSGIWSPSHSDIVGTSSADGMGLPRDHIPSPGLLHSASPERTRTMQSSPQAIVPACTHNAIQPQLGISEAGPIWRQPSPPRSSGDETTAYAGALLRLRESNAIGPHLMLRVAYQDSQQDLPHGNILAYLQMFSAVGSGAEADDGVHSPCSGVQR